MAVEHLALVFQAEGLTGPEKLLLLAYANYTDPHGYCWPGVPRLAADTGTSESTVKRVRKQLEAKRLLRHQRRTTKAGDADTNLYRINVDKLRAMRRVGGRFGDNVLALEFDIEDDDTTPVDQRIVQSGPTLGQSEPTGVQSGRTGGVNLDPPSGQSEPLSVIDPVLDPSLEERYGRTEDISTMKSPDQWAVDLVVGLDFGRHRRPTRQQAEQLAALVQKARDEHGLSTRELTRHCRQVLNEATRSAVAYLTGGLSADRLPIPAQVKAAEAPATADGCGAPVSAQDLISRGLDPRLLPSRLRESVR